LADVLGADLGKIVRWIFDLSHDVARAEDELEFEGASELIWQFQAK
jgi:hypothetical protein